MSLNKCYKCNVSCTKSFEETIVEEIDCFPQIGCAGGGTCFKFKPTEAPEEVADEPKIRCTFATGSTKTFQSIDDNQLNGGDTDNGEIKIICFKQSGVKKTFKTKEVSVRARVGPKIVCIAAERGKTFRTKSVKVAVNSQPKLICSVKSKPSCTFRQIAVNNTAPQKTPKIICTKQFGSCTKVNVRYCCYECKCCY